MVGKIDLYKGDCLEVMESVELSSIDLIYIDPPFGIKTDEKFNMIAWKKTNYYEKIVYDMFEKILNENDLKRIVKRVIIEQDEPSVTGLDRKDQVIRNSFIRGLESLLLQIKRNEPKYGSFTQTDNFEKQFSRFRDDIEDLLNQTESMF